MTSGKAPAGVNRLSLENKLFLVRSRKDTKNHIRINHKKCRRCSTKTCLIVCPAKTYEKRRGKIEIAYDNCLECGSCRVACAQGAITWENPRGGFGVSFENG